MYLYIYIYSISYYIMTLHTDIASQTYYMYVKLIVFYFNKFNLNIDVGYIKERNCFGCNIYVKTYVD